MLINSNSEYIIKLFYLVLSGRKFRIVEVQKILCQNCYAVKYEYDMVTLPVFLSIMSHEDFNPPSNM